MLDMSVRDWIYAILGVSSIIGGLVYLVRRNDKIDTVEKSSNEKIDDSKKDMEKSFAAVSNLLEREIKNRQEESERNFKALLNLIEREGSLRKELEVNLKHEIKSSKESVEMQLGELKSQHKQYLEDQRNVQNQLLNIAGKIGELFGALNSLNK